MKKIIAMLINLTMLISLCGCAPVKTSETKKAATVIFTDSTGRKVEVPSKINKIAVSGPLTQIVLYSLAPEMLVGYSSDWSKDVQQYIPEKYLKLPVLGQLYGGKGELNLEQLLSAAPDVVIDVGESKDTIIEDFNALQKKTGIPFVHIEAVTQTMGDAYRQLGKLLNLEERAETFADYCETVYKQTVKISEAAGKNKKNALYILGDKGLNVIAQGSYHSEVIDMLCNNLAVVKSPSSKGSGNEVDMEQIMQWNPEIIIFAPDSIFDKVANDPKWQQIQAINTGNYYEVPYGPYNWLGFPPSIQRYLGMLWLSKLLYPNLTDYDLKTEVIKYYKMFYHYTLTDGQYQNLISKAIH